MPEKIRHRAYNFVHIYFQHRVNYSKMGILYILIQSTVTPPEKESNPSVFPIR